MDDDEAEAEAEAEAEDVVSGPALVSFFAIVSWQRTDWDDSRAGRRAGTGIGQVSRCARR